MDCPKNTLFRIRAIHREAVGGTALAAEAQIAAARRIAHHARSQHRRKSRKLRPLIGRSEIAFG